MSTESPAGSGSHPPERVIVRSYPQIILLYPTLVAALIFGVCTSFTTSEELQSTWCKIFLLITGLNLVVLTFDFPRTTSLTLFFLAIAVVCLGLWLNDRLEVVTWLNNLIGALKPSANAEFYYTVVGGMIVLYVLVFLVTRFDYWEIMHNELIHHHGILGNVHRYPAPQLKLEKEITDVFEFLLLRTGRLILHPSSERRAIVLENIPNINNREGQIQELLRTLSVRIHGQEYAQESS